MIMRTDNGESENAKQMTDPLKECRDIPGTVHATALVVGETGILVVGPSGSGKSRVAMDLMQAARSNAMFTGLISDDQVGLRVAGTRVIAVAPPTIAGMIEVRGSGILKLVNLPRAVMHVAIATVRLQADLRLPEADARYSPIPGVDLPLINMVPGQINNPMELVNALRQNRLVL